MEGRYLQNARVLQSSGVNSSANPPATKSSTDNLSPKRSGNPVQKLVQKGSGQKTTPYEARPLPDVQHKHSNSQKPLRFDPHIPSYLQELRNCSPNTMETLASDYPQAQKASVSLQALVGKISTLEDDLNTSMMQQYAIGDQLKSSQRECEVLRNQNRDLRKKLDDAQGYVFSLQRREQKFTEAEAISEFSSLCGMVDDWVTSRLGDQIDNRRIEEGSLLHPGPGKLLNLMSAPGKDAFAVPDTDECNVVAAIMRFLYEQIFDQEFYCPIEPNGLELLKSIRRSMRNLEPRRDLITWRTWYSETLIAVTQRQEFSKQRRLHSRKLANDLAAMLQVFLPHSEHEALPLSLQSKIITPALELAHKMQLSVDAFSLEYTLYRELKLEDRHPLSRESSPYDCVLLDPPGKSQKFPVPKGTLTYLFDINPALVFRAVKADSFGERRVLKPAEILIAVTEEGHGPYTRPSTKLRETATLLAWLHETIQARQISGSTSRGTQMLVGASGGPKLLPPPKTIT